MGILYNNLPDKEALETYISNYAGYDNVTVGRDCATLEYLMRFWEENKSKYLYHLLNDNYIIEKDVYYEKALDEMSDEIWTACTNRYSKMKRFYDNYDSFCEDIYNKMKRNADLSDDCYDNTPWIVSERLHALISCNNLAKNSYSYSTVSIDTPSGKKLTINNGCKPIRMLAKIAETFGIDGFEDFRLEHSRILNQKKLKGTLCLSIHPLDYLTMSDNTYGWDSCMNWMEGGQYRMGTVEMMNSPCVIVAYLKGDDKLKFSGYEWNSKKWRNLFIVDKNIITSIKGYPYISEQLDSAACNWIAELAAKNLGLEYSFVAHKDCNSHYIDLPVEDGEGFISIRFEFDTGIMYNDFGNNTSLTYRLNKDIDPYERYYICYSGPAECMYCGQLVYLDDLDDEGCVICGNCASFETCCCCGERINDYNTYELDGNYYCEYCYQDHVMYCPLEEEDHDMDNCSLLYVLNDDINLDAAQISSGALSKAVLGSLNYYDEWYITHNAKKYYYSDIKIINVTHNDGYFGAYDRRYTVVKLSDCTDKFKDIYEDYRSPAYI